MKKTLYIKNVRTFLDEEYTSHLHRKSLNTEDVDELKSLVKRAKKTWASMVSESDQLINCDLEND